MVVVSVMLAACGGGGGGDDKAQPQNPQTPAEITTIAPATVTAGGPAFALVVRGFNFSDSSVVRVDGEVRRDATVVSATRITIPMSAADIAIPGEIIIGVDSSTAVLVVTGAPWKTATNAPAKAQKMGVDGLLYTAYEQAGDVFLTRFDENGEKISIDGQTDVALTAANSTQAESAKGLALTNRNAHVLVLRSPTAGVENAVIVSVDLFTGAKTERVVMSGGQLTGFADDGAGAIFIAFTVPQGMSVIRGIDIASAQTIFEQVFGVDRKMLAVAANATTVYIGGLITNGTGGQARILVRAANRSTGTVQWEIQLTATARSANSDVLHAGSFILDPGSDALYFSGTLNNATTTAQGVITRIKASTGSPDWSEAKAGLELSFELLAADVNGDIYGYHRPTDSIARLNLATMATDPTAWERTLALQPTAIYANGGIVYVPRPSGAIVRIARDGQQQATATLTAPAPPPAPEEPPEEEIEEPDPAD